MNSLIHTRPKVWYQVRYCSAPVRRNSVRPVSSFWIGLPTHTHTHKRLRVVSQFTNECYEIKKCISWFTNKCQMIHKSVTFIYILNVHLHTFPNLWTSKHFLWIFFTLLTRLDPQMHFFQKEILCSLSDVSYNFRQKHQPKFEGMTECKHIALYLYSVQLCGLLHHIGQKSTNKCSDVHKWQAVCNRY